MKGSFIRLLIAFAMCVSSQVYADVRASLDRNPVAFGETVRLTITMDEQQLADQVDTTALDASFALLGRNVRSLISMAIGVVTTETHLELTLQPRYTGEITIPAIKVGQSQTAPLLLKVTEQSLTASQQADQAPPVLIEAQWVNTGRPYVQSQINLAVRIYHTGSLPGAALGEPRPKDTLVKRLGEDSQSVETKNGIQYQVLERQFALFPQKSGSLLVPAIAMQMRAPVPRDQARRTFGFDVFSQRMITLHTQTLTIDVLPRPANDIAEAWLPAEQVTLEQSGLPEGDILVGEAINLQINLSALGLTGAQLPEVQVMGLNEQFKLYPDQPAFTESLDGNTIEGKRTQMFVLIPSKAGSLEIPLINVSWWDRVNDRPQQASLPAITVQVNDPGTDSEAYDLNTVVLEDATTAGILESVDSTSSAIMFQQSSPAWKWLSIASLAGWLLSLLYFLFIYDPHRGHPKPLAIDSEQLDLRALLKQIKTAANANQAEKTWQALQVYARNCWPKNPPQTPEDWADRLNHPESGIVLAELDASLFRNRQTADWSGDRVSTVLIPELVHAQPGVKNDAQRIVPQLYPS
jgi:hypothetical protein